MGKCKNCNTDVPDGQNVCIDCEKLKNEENKSKESYLDSLLNSIVNSQPDMDNDSETIRPIRKRRVEHEVKDLEEPVNKIEQSQGDMEQKMKKNEMNYNEDTIMNDPFENNDSIEEIDTNGLEEQALDLNNIFDFMDMVGENTDNKEWLSSISNDENKDINENATTSSDNFLEGDLNDILDSQLDISMDDYSNDTTDEITNENRDEELIETFNIENETNDLLESSSMDDDILSEDSDDFNELLSFLSNDDDSLQTDINLDENSVVSNLSDVSTEDDIFSFDTYENETESPNFELGSDLGDVFADTLGAVSTLEDPTNIDDLSNFVIPDLVVTGNEIKKKEKESKRSIFKELFSSSSKDEPNNNQAKDLNNKNKPAAKKKKSTKKSSKKSKQDLKDGEKEKGKSLDFLKKNKTSKNSKQKPKKSAKIKKSKKEEEIEIDHGKINKFAATFIFTVFAIIAVVVLSGTEVVSYSTSISTANKEFERKRYNYAYEAIHGVEVKDKDMELYDKVMTVMFVSKQLNSYNNYYSVEAYPEALDSLLKGLKRYDKYISLAKELGIETDLNYVRKQILAELKKSYNLSEKEAVDIIHSKDQTEYSIQLYNAVIENKPIEEKGTK